MKFQIIKIIQYHILSNEDGFYKCSFYIFFYKKWIDLKNCKPIFKDTEKEEKIIFFTGVGHFTSISCIPVSPGTVRRVREGRWWSRPCIDRSPPSARGYTGSSRSPSPGRQARRTLSVKNTAQISTLYCALSLLTKSLQSASLSFTCWTEKKWIVKPCLAKMSIHVSKISSWFSLSHIWITIANRN